MKKKSIKKLSILGLVLMAASAVTAAILPSKAKSNDSNFVDNGQLIASTGGFGNQQSCVTALANFECEKTAESGTTVSGNTSGGTDTNGDNTSAEF